MFFNLFIIGLSFLGIIVAKALIMEVPDFELNAFMSQPVSNIQRMECRVIFLAENLSVKSEVKTLFKEVEAITGVHIVGMPSII